MKLFTVGPVEMYPDTLKEAGKQLPYFRTDEFSNVMFEIEKRLKELMHSGNDSKAIVLTGSGSAAMEAVVNDAFTSEDRLLVVNGGSFGERFVKLCQIHQIPYDELHLVFGETLTQEHFDKIDGNRYTALLVNIHETSTGQLYDIDLISNFTKKYQLTLVVDAISSFLADAYDMDKYGIDCTIISSQKALALSPGISMIIMKNSFYEQKIEGKPITNLYLSIKEHVQNMQRGQTPNTPAVGIILELAQRLQQIQADGLQNLIDVTAEKAKNLRQQLHSIHVNVPSYPLSNALTPIYFAEGGAQKVYQSLKNEYGIYVTPTGGSLSDKLLRIGHLGNLNEIDYVDLTDKLQEVIK